MKIVTHDGIFHADDVFAMAMLRRLYAPIRIVRTRDMSEVEEGDFVIDVGGEYDPARNRFDHHHGLGDNSCRPKVFDGDDSELPLPYASFGLLWKARGVEYCRKLVSSADLFSPAETLHYRVGAQEVMAFVQGKVPGVPACPPGGELLHNLIEKLVQRVDAVLVSAIDAADNGIFVRGPTYALGAAIAACNVSWAEEFYGSANGELRALTANALAVALGLADTVLLGVVMREFYGLYAESAVEAVFKAAGGGPVVTLPIFMPWGAVASRPEYAHVRYVVFPAMDGNWRTQAVPQPGSSGLKLRKAFPMTWRALSDAALQEVCGVPNALFCHKSGFMVSAKTQAAAEQLAILANDYRGPAVIRRDPNRPEETIPL